MRLMFVCLMLTASPVWAQPDTTATVEHIVIDYEAHAVEQKFLILPDGKRVRIKGVNEWTTGQKVKVKKAKIRKADKARVSAETTEAEVDVVDLEVVALDISSALPPTSTVEAHVVHVDWSSPQPWATPALAAANYAKVNTQYRENSFGALGWSPTFYWVTIAPPVGCDYTAIMGAAMQTLAAQGVVVPTNKHRQFVLQSNSACGWSGIAGVNGLWSLLNGSYLSTAHEWGHNLGRGHSGFASCTSTGCTTQTYGDVYCPMGHSGRGTHFNAFHKMGFGWIVPLTVLPGTSGTFTLAPYETISSGHKALRVHIPDGSSSSGFKYYFVESRSLFGGAVILHEFANLKDLAPLTADNDQVLDVGQTFTFQDGTRITTFSASAAGASIQIQRPSIRQPSRPTRPRVESRL